MLTANWLVALIIGYIMIELLTKCNQTFCQEKYFGYGTALPSLINPLSIPYDLHQPN